jgi:hypothetical protein
MAGDVTDKKKKKKTAGKTIHSLIEWKYEVSNEEWLEASVLFSDYVEIVEHILFCLSASCRNGYWTHNHYNSYFNVKALMEL